MKRFLALLTALLMLLSMAFFVGCDKKDKDSDDDDAKKELTAKEQFNASLEDALNGITNETGNLTGSSLNGKADAVGSFLLTLDTIKYSGVDLSSMGDIALSGTIKSDVDSNLVSVDMTASIFGDEPTLGVLVDASTSEGYITDFFGLNDKPLYIPTATEGMDEEQLKAIQEFTEKADKIAEDVVKALTSAINKNINDSCYKTEKYTVTVNGVEFKNATVNTLTIDSALAAGVVRDFLTELLKIEGLGELLENELDIDDVIDDMTELEKIVIKTVSADGKTVGINVDIKADDETVSTRIALIKDNFKLEMGVIKEDGSYDYEQGVLLCEYIFNAEAGTQKASLGWIEGDYTEELFKLEADVENGVYDGRITLNMDGDEIYVDYLYESTETGAKITIEDLDGLGVPFPVSIAIEYSITDTKCDLTASFSCNDGDMELAATLNYSIEVGDVTIEEVTDYINAEDFDVSNFEKDFKKLYPTLYSFLNFAGI